MSLYNLNPMHKDVYSRFVLVTHRSVKYKTTQIMFNDLLASTTVCMHNMVKLKFWIKLKVNLTIIELCFISQDKETAHTSRNLFRLLYFSFECHGQCIWERKLSRINFFFRVVLLSQHETEFYILVAQPCSQCAHCLQYTPFCMSMFNLCSKQMWSLDYFKTGDDATFNWKFERA